MPSVWWWGFTQIPEPTRQPPNTALCCPAGRPLPPAPQGGQAGGHGKVPWREGARAHSQRGAQDKVRRARWRPRAASSVPPFLLFPGLPPPLPPGVSPHLQPPLSSPLHLPHTLARLDTLSPTCPGSQCQVTSWHSTTGRHDPPAALVEATANIHAHPGPDACCAPGEGPSWETCSEPPLAPGTARCVQGEPGTLQPHPLGGNTGPHASVLPPQHPATLFCPVLHTVRTPTPTSPPLGPGSCSAVPTGGAEPELWSQQSLCKATCVPEASQGPATRTLPLSPRKPLSRGPE